MGVVWRERLARFEREAKLLASLNHPHIATVYGLHEHEGTRFLAMELIEGEDLSQRIRRGALPVEPALEIARQVAEATETAHDSGVIHRDLKPANIMLTADGQVKVLDFGLAKVLAPAGDLSDSPTVTSGGTVAGVLLGTPAYMSPEQARGEPVDKRADIWAFGCVLYEMLTGRCVHDGRSISDLIAAILTREPDWSALPAGLPWAARRLLARCLDKEARTRLRDIGEARVALSAPPDESDAESSAMVGRPIERRVLLAFVAVLAAVLAWRVFVPGASSGEAGGVPSFTLSRLTELKMLLYDSAVGGNSDVYLLRVGGKRAINLTEDSEFYDGQAAFAPDGERIAFRSERDGGGLFVMGATGESVRRVTDLGFNPAWSPDGRQLAFANEAVGDPYSRAIESELWKVDLRDGATTRLTETDAVQPAWSPDGGRIAFWSNTGGQRDVWTVDAAGGEPLAVTSDRFTDWSPAWSPDGRWLYFSSDRGGSMNLWRVPIDAASGRTRGEPQRVTGGVRGMGHAGFSSDGSRLVLMAYERKSILVFQEIDPSEPCSVRATRVLSGQSPSWCSMSPDAQWLACTIRGAREDIVVLRPNGSDVRRLTDDPDKDRFPTWMPDGESVTFLSTRSGDWEYWTIRTDGSGLRRLTDLGGVGGSVISPDGRRMMVSANDFQELWSVDTDRLNTRENAKQIDIGVPSFDAVGWSPEDDRIAGRVIDESGRPFGYGIYDVGSETYLPLEQHTMAPPHRAQVAGWLPDSRRLVLVSGSDVVVHDTATGEWCTLLPADTRERYRLDANGTVLLVERDRLDSAQSLRSRLVLLILVLEVFGQQCLLQPHSVEDDRDHEQ